VPAAARAVREAPTAAAAAERAATGAGAGAGKQVEPKAVGMPSGHRGRCR
jgi:hypothetical protein